jgi:cobalamin biosynthesis protein CbiD
MEENIYKQHSEHSDWMNRVAFYKEEITILNQLLSEIANKNSSDEALKDVEHYQNQFIIQKNNLDKLAHNIRIHEQKLQHEVDSNPVAVDHRKTEYHQAEKEFLDYFENNFSTLRKDFKTFASKWM